MKKIRYFVDVLDGQQRWLNAMANKGFRLVGTTRMGYEFEQCTPQAYTYIVQYVAEKSLKELKDYRQYLEDLGYVHYGKNVNMQFGPKAKVRYDGKRLSLATNPGVLNQELLIIEVPKGQELTLFTTAKEHYEYYAMLRNVYGITTIAFLFLAFFGSSKLELFGHTYLDQQFLFLQIPVFFVGLYTLCITCKLYRRTRAWKQKMTMYE